MYTDVDGDYEVISAPDLEPVKTYFFLLLNFGTGTGRIGKNSVVHPTTGKISLRLYILLLSILGNRDLFSYVSLTL